jgi:hypothetical protein
MVTAIKEKFPDAKWGGDGREPGEFPGRHRRKVLQRRALLSGSPDVEKYSTPEDRTPDFTTICTCIPSINRQRHLFRPDSGGYLHGFSELQGSQKTGIDFFVSSGRMQDRSELEEIGRIENDNIYIYKIKDP